MKTIPLCLVAIAFLCSFNASAEELRAETSLGPVLGKRSGATVVFKGIPFAAPPVGELRFREPRDASPWKEPRIAHAYGSKCLQIPFNKKEPKAEGSEDCLYLNVWKPAGDVSGLPVMVFIHGGGNVNGSASESFLGLEVYKGEYLASLGAVLITINYRLGPLGFMAHPALSEENSPGGSGNYGLLDQIAALRWVKKNAAAFGGNSGNVTVFGESAGAIDILALIASPLAQGLFQKAIVQSGLLVEIPLAKQEELGTELAVKIGCGREIDGASAACLREKSGQAILEAASYDTGGKLKASVPTIEGHVLPAGVLESLRGGRGSIPLLIGTTAEEMRTLGPIAAGTDKIDTAEKYEALVRGYYGPRAGEVLARYPAGSYEMPRYALEDLLGDEAIQCPTRRVARAFAAAAPVWRYVFSHVGDHPLSKPYGAGHAMELPYVFHNQLALVTTPREVKLSEQIAAYWFQFARSGNPNAEGLPAWPLSERDEHLSLDVEMAAGANFHGANCDFVDSL